jgi:hypothetical protein
LRRAFAVPSCREYEALVEYAASAKLLGQWRDLARDFELPPASEHEFALAIFAHYEKAGRLTEALALIAANPRLVVPSRMRGEQAPATAVTCAGLRAWARRSGAFVETAKLFELLAQEGLQGIEAERVALDADRARAGGEPALGQLSRAAQLDPATWDFARNCAEAQLAARDRAGARVTLERFLAVSLQPTEREAALNLWEQTAKSP